MNYNFISVFCSLGGSPSIPSMSYIEEEEEKDYSRGKSKEQEKSGKDPEDAFRSPHQTARETPDQIPPVKKVQFVGTKAKPVNVIQGFGYLLTDIFANSEDFDMRKVQKKEKQRQEEEIKNALIRAKASSPARKLKRHQSPARIRELQKKKSRRSKEREERRQKLLEIRSYPVYKLIRIKSSIAGAPALSVDAPFMSSEIDEARLRMLNREYFLNKELEELERLLDEEDIELFDPKDSNEVDIGKVIREDKLEGLLLPKQRCQGGA